MLKRFLINLAILAGLAVPVHAAGTLPGFSLTPQFDSSGNLARGCKLYVIQAGTTATPQNAYQDSGLTNALPNPIPCDASGRLPQFYLADGQIKVRLVDKNGTQIFVGDNLLVIGPSSGGGGGGGSVDPTTIFETGAIKVKYGTGSLAGWVRLNGRTIGSATSGATERANSDTQALFEYLWGADSSLAVSGGRGATAAADWAANKTIALPNAQARTLAGLADMGATPSTLLDGTTFTFGNATTLGSTVGAARQSLVTANLPPYTPSGTVTGTATVTPQVDGSSSSFRFLSAVGGPLGFAGGSYSERNGTQTTSTGPISATFTGTAQGGTSTAFDTVSPLLLVTMYIKL